MPRSFLRDFRFACSALARQPGFTLVVVATLGLPEAMGQPIAVAVVAEVQGPTEPAAAVLSSSVLHAL